MYQQPQETKNTKRICKIAGIAVGLFIITYVICNWYVMFNTNKVSKTSLLTYLEKVYPNIDRNRTQREYKTLYDRLGWYYQCCNKFDSYYDLNTLKVVGGMPTGPRGVLKHVERLPLSDMKNIKETTVLPCCAADAGYKLPSVPSGFIYDWSSFQHFNVGTIEVKNGRYKYAGDSNWGLFGANAKVRDVSTYFSQPPGFSFEGITGDASITADDPLGVKDGKNVGLWVGPGAFYAGARAIMRAMYYPFGPLFNANINKWSLDKSFNPKDWITMMPSVKMLTSQLAQPVDKYSGKTWIKGFAAGDQFEICHVQQIPGMTDSTGYWFNYFGGGGSGIFYKCGKTPVITVEQAAAVRDAVPDEYKYLIDMQGCVPRNKTQALFTLLWETKKKIFSENVGYLKPGIPGKRVQFVTKSGSDLLKEMYGTDDPWFITYWHCNAYAPQNKKLSGPWLQQKWTGVAWEPTGDKLPDHTADSNEVPCCHGFTWADYWNQGHMGPNATVKKRQVMQSFLLGLDQIGHKQLNQPGTWTGTQLYDISSFSSLCAFLLSCEFDENSKERDTYYSIPEPYTASNGEYFYDADASLRRSWKDIPIIQTVPETVGQPTEAGVKYSLAKVFMGNWFYDRVANGVGFDEAMQYFGNILGYETIQMAMNTNTNGSWSFESIDIRVPDVYGWKKDVLTKRKYNYYTQKHAVNDGWGLSNPTSYSIAGIVEFNKLFAKSLSQEDPFKTNKTMNCFNIGGIPCNAPTGSSYKCRQQGEPMKFEDMGGDVPYRGKYFNSLCTLKDKNIGSKEISSQAIQDDKNMCHIPWGQLGQKKNWGEGQGLEYMTPAGPMGHSYCQSDNGITTFSSLWSNVAYGADVPNVGDAIVIPATRKK